MNKNEFLMALRKKLDILEESEIEDIINEYDGYIEEKINQGASEKEAVESFGNLNELAAELLKAYKIKQPSKNTRGSFNNLVDAFLKIMERIIDVFSHKDLKDIIRFVLELMVIFLIIGVCKLPFILLEEMGGNIFQSLGYTLYPIVRNIWNFIIEIFYVIFSVLMFVKIFENRYLGEEIKIEKKSSINQEQNLDKKPKTKKDVKEKEKHTGFGFIDFLVHMFVLFLKVIAFCILIGFAFYIVGMAMGVGVSVYLLFQGVFYFGAYLIVLALLALGGLVFSFLFNFIFDRKNRLGVLFISSLVSFILLGVGVSIFAIEIASTSISYDHQLADADKEVVTYEMKDNMILEGYYDEIIVDDKLGNQIKIEYVYNDEFLTVENYSHSSKHGQYEFLYVNYDILQLRYNKKVFQTFIEDLKKKEINVYKYDVQVKVYASSEVKAQLEKNAEMYGHFEAEDPIEDVCDYLEENGYSLPSYCIDEAMDM